MSDDDLARLLFGRPSNELPIEQTGMPATDEAAAARFFGLTPDWRTRKAAEQEQVKAAEQAQLAETFFGLTPRDDAANAADTMPSTGPAFHVDRGDQASHGDPEAQRQDAERRAAETIFYGW